MRLRVQIIPGSLRTSQAFFDLVFQQSADSLWAFFEVICENLSPNSLFVVLEVVFESSNSDGLWAVLWSLLVSMGISGELRGVSVQISLGLCAVSKGSPGRLQAILVPCPIG